MTERPADVVVADPRDGAVIAPGATETDVLCDLALELKRRERELAAMHKAVERELARRLNEHDRAGVTVGGYALKIKIARTREWDTAELEGVLRDLVDRGLVTAGEFSEVIQTTRKVKGDAAQRLLGQLTGDAHKAVNDCFRWRESKPQVVVERVDPQRQLER